MENNTRISNSFEERQQRKKEMFSGYEYINWLENAIGLYKKLVSSNHHLILSTDKDYENLSSLHLFFEGIEDYARKNFISPSKEKEAYYNCFYLVEYNRCVYKISMRCQYEVVFSVEMAESTLSNEIINFNDVVKNF